MREIILFIILGFVMHQTKHLTSKAPTGWSNLAEHSIGAIMLYVAARYMLRILGATREEMARFDTASVYSALGVGGGVTLGWIVGTILHTGRR